VLRVLLVCTGNICRSPIAHGVLSERSSRLSGGEIEVLSAGTWARDGYPATPGAVAAAAKIGVDIAGHLTSRFTGDLARWADLVVTMTAEQAVEVQQEASDATDKTFTLKELASILAALPPAVEPTREAVVERVAEADRTRRAGHGLPADVDVADPLGLDRSAYRAAAEEIEELIDDLLAGLLGERVVLARKS
jgi:protein-tyrosine phosphatase